jgi:hypothetical protein
MVHLIQQSTKQHFVDIAVYPLNVQSEKIPYTMIPITKYIDVIGLVS